MKSIGELTALITALGTVLTAIGGIGLKLVATWITGVRGLIREETKDLTSQNKELQEGHKKINLRLDRIEGVIQKVETRATALESKLELIRTDIKDLTSEGGKYADLMKNISNMSANGQWNMFLNNMKLTMNDIGTTLLPAVTDLLRSVNETMEEHRRVNESKNIIKQLQSTPYLSKAASEALTGGMSTTSLAYIREQDLAYTSYMKKYGSPADDLF